MKTLALLIFSIALTGCTTLVPVKRNFPEAPKVLKEKCEDLKILESDKISELFKVMIENYQTHYTCVIKVDAWQQWYEEQKKIFEGVK